MMSAICKLAALQAKLFGFNKAHGSLCTAINATYKVQVSYISSNKA